jgi:hypothetical protein
MKVYHLSWAGLLIAICGLGVAVGHAWANGFDAVSVAAIGTAVAAAINALLPSAIPPGPVTMDEIEQREIFTPKKS